MGGSAVGRSGRAEQKLTRVVVNQAVAGTTTIKSAALGVRHSVVGGLLTLDADGTLKFGGSNSGDLTGPFDIAAQGGFAIPQDDASLVLGAANEDLTITTTGGAAHGVLLIETE